MRILVILARVLIGLLFIAGGIIIFIDPTGAAYRLHDFFEYGFLNSDISIIYVLILIILVGTIEILFGLMLLLGYVRILTCVVLLFCALLFSYLSFHYANATSTTHYGSLRAALSLSKWQVFNSYFTSVFLLLLLLFKNRYIHQVFKISTTKWIIFAAFLCCIGFTYQGIMHTPLIDFSPVKVGSSYYSTLQKGMPWDEQRPSPSEHLIPFRRTEVQSDIVYHKNKILLIVSPSINLHKKQAWKAIKKVTDKALDSDYEVVGLTASEDKVIERVKNEYALKFDFNSAKKTSLKILVRSNPGLLNLYKGKITQKAHWNEVDELQLN